MGLELCFNENTYSVAEEVRSPPLFLKRKGRVDMK